MKSRGSGEFEILKEASKRIYQNPDSDSAGESCVYCLDVGLFFRLLSLCVRYLGLLSLCDRYFGPIETVGWMNIGVEVVSQMSMGGVMSNSPILRRKIYGKKY